jgi:hypothetical protein
MIHRTKGIKSSDIFRSLEETELTGVAGGRMKLPEPDRARFPLFTAVVAASRLRPSRGPRNRSTFPPDPRVQQTTGPLQIGGVLFQRAEVRKRFFAKALPDRAVTSSATARQTVARG